MIMITVMFIMKLEVLLMKKSKWNFNRKFILKNAVALVSISKMKLMGEFLTV